VNHLISPHGGTLVDGVPGEARVAELKQESVDWPSHSLTSAQLCDLELILNGGYSPLTGFMGAVDHASVCAEMRLANGTLWPMPVTLDVSDDLAERVSAGDVVALRDPEGVMVAAVTVDEAWEPDREAEVAALFGTEDRGREDVAAYLQHGLRWAIAGPVEGVQLPVHYDYRELRLTPLELRRRFTRLGWRRVLAFQTHQTVHRAQRALTEHSAQDLAANLLIHPVVGHSRPGDPDYYTRVRCYQALLDHYPRDMARLSLLPLATRGAGAREPRPWRIRARGQRCPHLRSRRGLGAGRAPHRRAADRHGSVP
jgi:sulfate adenylyltransferase